MATETINLEDYITWTLLRGAIYKKCLNLKRGDKLKLTVSPIKKFATSRYDLIIIDHDGKKIGSLSRWNIGDHSKYNYAITISNCKTIATISVRAKAGTITKNKKVSEIELKGIVVIGRVRLMVRYKGDLSNPSTTPELKCKLSILVVNGNTVSRSTINATIDMDRKCFMNKGKPIDAINSQEAFDKLIKEIDKK